MWPDFAGGSIFNLMQGVIAARGGRPLGPLPDGVDIRRWADAPTLVLLVLDGVGMAQLDLLPHTAFLRRHCTRTLTSVFPSTTATAITTFMTGCTPARHGVTGWHVRCEEVGDQVIAVLPVRPRGDIALGMTEDQALERLHPVDDVFSGLRLASSVISPADIADSSFNRRHSRGAQRTAYRGGMIGLLQGLSGVLDAVPAPGYVYAYWPDFDHCAHHQGCRSDQAAALLAEADAALEAWCERWQGPPIQLVVTADHGFIDAAAERLLELENFPALIDCLDGPLSGERRAVFCHVKSGRRRDFERALGDLSHACTPWPIDDLLAARRFGDGPVHPRLRSRLGDWLLEMKDDWTLRDTLPGERPFRLIGVHGGSSAAEMRVPLIELCAGNR
ncbi:alkaline phosphatase family protein [Methyloversatilis thermotolerans]|uniref:alkaline phosphatase family protein n=1 Tax=Methyloversatilis thermotolerans TaxID=1346290 RepID=UPI00036EB234|nr:alkaline phosphatase family protein [Methyloversatilis thermotolerans]